MSNLQDRELQAEVMILPDSCPAQLEDCGQPGLREAAGEGGSLVLAPYSHDVLDGRPCGRILLSVEDYVAEIAWQGLCPILVGPSDFVEHSDQGITVERAGDEVVVTVGEALEETRL